MIRCKEIIKKLQQQKSSMFKLIDYKGMVFFFFVSLVHMKKSISCNPIRI